MKFKKDFKFGGSIAAEEVEGIGTTSKAATEWDLFYQQDSKYFFHSIGNHFTNDMMNHYKTDLELFKAVGCNYLRYSFSWSRIFDNPNDIVNKKAVKYYHDFLAYAKKLGIEVCMTLMHFDLPAYLFKNKLEDGWVNKKTINKFVKFSEFIFQEFKEVKSFATFNEPLVALSGYDGSKARWPRINDPKKKYLVAFHQALAHALVSNLFHSKYKTKNNELGVVINWLHCYPKDNINFSKFDLQAAENFNYLNNYLFLDPMINGNYDPHLIDLLKKQKLYFYPNSSELKILAKTKTDWLGVNFYNPERVCYKKDMLYQKWHWNKARFNVFRGWEIYPNALSDIAEIIKKRYQNIKWMITENGMGVENEEIFRDHNNLQIQDDYRIAFISEHLAVLNQIIANGANCQGYLIWSVIDNWSWINGYKNRYGLIEINLNNMERRIKKSGYFFAKIANSFELPDNFKKVDQVMDLNSIKYTKSK